MKVLHIEDRFHPNMGYQLNYFAVFHNPGFEFLNLTTSDTFPFGSRVNSKDDIIANDIDFEKKYI